jgi:hypothetical protein
MLSNCMFDRLKITDRKNDANQRRLQIPRLIDWLYKNGSNLYEYSLTYLDLEAAFNSFNHPGALIHRSACFAKT